jgi:biopolymer transport protein ExbB/TolQ
MGAFAHVADVDPSRKARVLAEAISEAMNLTAAGIVAQLVGCVVALVLGWTLLRRTATLVSPGD